MKKQARIGVDDLALDLGEGTSYCTNTNLNRVVGRAHCTSGGCLGLTVYGDYLAHVHLYRRAAHEVRGAVSSCHDTRPHIREVGSGKVGMIEHSDKHRRHTVEAGDALVVYAGERGLGGEVRNRTESTAVSHHGGHREYHSEAMEHRYLYHHTVCGGQIHSVTDGLTVVDDIAVGEHNALGEARCTRGVLHITYVVGSDEGRTAAYLLTRNERGAREHLLPIETSVHSKADGNDVTKEGQILRIEGLSGLEGLELGTELLYDLLVVDILTILNHNESVTVIVDIVVNQL